VVAQAGDRNFAKTLAGGGGRGGGGGVGGAGWGGGVFLGGVWGGKRGGLLGKYHKPPHKGKGGGGGRGRGGGGARRRRRLSAGGERWGPRSRLPCGCSWMARWSKCLRMMGSLSRDGCTRYRVRRCW